MKRPAGIRSVGEGGEGILRFAISATAVFAAVALSAAVVPDLLTPLAVVVSLVLFGSGIVVFLWAYGIAVQRSRTDLIGIGGLFFLVGSAPARVRRILVGCTVLQVVVAFVAASVRPFTGLAFVVLVPVLGLGLSGLWGARHGQFPPRR